MKLTVISLLSSLVWTALPTPVMAAAPLRVVLDAGHGGKDHGARHGELSEANLTLRITDILVRKLKADSRFSTLITRNQDEFVDLEDRVRRAGNSGGELFLSIHVNWSSDSRAQGMEVYFQNQLPPDEESMFLAARENQEKNGAVMPDPRKERLRRPATGHSDPEVELILQDLGRNHRIHLSSQLATSIKMAWKGNRKAASKSVRQAPFFVISNLNMPSALVEVGFLSHPKEGPLLATPEYQEQVAQSLHDGLILYYESLDKTPRSRLQ